MVENMAHGDLAGLPLGRSVIRRRIAALLLDGQGRRFHLREVARRTSATPGTAARELASLVAAGIVTREAEGRQVYFRGAPTPLAEAIRSLLRDRNETAERAASGTAPDHVSAARRFLEALRPAYRERVRAAYLLPPKGQPSVVELLLVLDAIERYADELEATSHAVAALSLELDVVFARVLCGAADWRARRPELLRLAVGAVPL